VGVINQDIYSSKDGFNWDLMVQGSIQGFWKTVAEGKKLATPLLTAHRG